MNDHIDITTPEGDEAAFLSQAIQVKGTLLAAIADNIPHEQRLGQYLSELAGGPRMVQHVSDEALLNKIIEKDLRSA